MIMEVRVYISMQAFTAKKAVFARRLSSSDIDFDCVLSALRILFGSDCIVEFLCLSNPSG